MSNEQMKETVRRLYEICNRGDYSAVDSLFSPNFIEHGMFGPGIPQNREGFVLWLKGVRQAFPDVHFESEEMGADGDRVWSRGTLTGTHQGDFFGIPATGKRVLMEFFNEFRIEHNLITDHWGQADLLGLMQQIGSVQRSGMQP